MNRSVFFLAVFSFVFLFSVSELYAQKKESALSALARELSQKPKEEPTQELDTYQKLEAQLEAYDIQRTEHLQQKKEFEQKRQEEQIRKQKEEEARVHYAKTLMTKVSRLKELESREKKSWQTLDAQVLSKQKEFYNALRVFERRQNNKLFLSTDIDWKNQLSARLDAIFKAYRQDLQRYQKNTVVQDTDGKCNLKIVQAGQQVKYIEERKITDCEKWIEKEEKELQALSDRVRKKQKSVIESYANATAKIKELEQKRLRR